MGGRLLCGWYYFDRGSDRAGCEVDSCHARREAHPDIIPSKGDLTMTTSHVEYPTIVSRAEWLTAGKNFLIKEKEFTRLRD
jgi:hypothetical protein